MLLYVVLLCLVLSVGVGIFQNFDRRRLEKIVKKAKKKEAGEVVGEPLDSFKTLQEKRLYRKLMQILNDSTHTIQYNFIVSV